MVGASFCALSGMEHTLTRFVPAGAGIAQAERMVNTPLVDVFAHLTVAGEAVKCSDPSGRSSARFPGPSVVRAH